MVGGLGEWPGPAAPGWDRDRAVRSGRWLNKGWAPSTHRAASSVPTGVDPGLSEHGFHWRRRCKCTSRGRPASQPSRRPVGVPTAAGSPSRAGLPGPQGPRAPLNRAYNDPRFPRQAFCCLVRLDLCGPSVSQLVPFCHRDKGLPRLVCTCVAFGSFRNALKLVISFVKPLSARLSETSKARGELAR